MRKALERAIEWVGGHHRGVLLGGLATALVAWAFLAFGRVVVAGRTLAFDDWVLLALRQPGHPERVVGPPWAAEVARDVTALGGTVVLWLATAAVAGFLALDRRVRAMAFVLVAVLGGWGLSFALKGQFQRVRPTVVPHLMPAHFSSFPSGHSMMSAVVYFTLGGLLASLVTKRRLKVYFLGLAALLSGLVGLSRLVLGVHYPTDVVAGWSVGLAWAALCSHVETLLARRGAIEPTL